jgi:transcription initiation factor TFIID subunit 7
MARGTSRPKRGSRATTTKKSEIGVPIAAEPGHSSSFVQLKFKTQKQALLRWPLITQWVAYDKRKQPTGQNEDQVGEPQDLQEPQTNKDKSIPLETGESGSELEDQAPVAPAASAPDSPDVPTNQPGRASTALQPAAPETPNDDDPAEAKQAPGRGTKTRVEKPGSKAGRGNISRLHTPSHRQQREAKSILKPTPSGIRKPGRNTTGKGVTIDLKPSVQVIIDSPGTHNSNEENESPSPSVTDSDDDAEMSDAPSTAKAKRPSLKIHFSNAASPAGGVQPAPAQTPGPQSATARTPIIKLKIGGGAAPSTPLATSQDGTKPKKKGKKDTADSVDVTPGSNKKRKRESIKGEDDEEGNRPAPVPPKPPTLRKITLKNTQTGLTPVPKATGAAQLNIKVKGKVPKRPLGVGYDSELEVEYENDKKEMVVGREIDPVVHEGFILRMQPGEDSDFLRKSIEDGKAGEMLTKGGAAINLRMLDTMGRRGILQIKDHKYATSLVDLPCIVEGMKSWDKKGWIKSIDICQMLLVLGRCKDEEEARSYPLPEDVDPKTYQYAHGITAPMKWVRKRRFARTKRARVDDIEAVERRVHALLEADQAALGSKYQLLDHDPRLDEHGYSTDMEEAEESDAEAEVDNYFDYHPGAYSVSTPMLTETPAQEEINQEDVDALERMFFDEDKVPANEPTVSAQNTLHPPEPAGDSSFNITSTSATPSATAEPTPAGDASSDEDDDDGGDDDEDREDAEKEGDENKRQALERIEDMTNKIAEQRELLNKTSNQILKKKLARKIQDLVDDVAMMKKSAGLVEAEEDE